MSAIQSTRDEKRSRDRNKSDKVLKEISFLLECQKVGISRFLSFYLSLL